MNNELFICTNAQTIEKYASSSLESLGSYYYTLSQSSEDFTELSVSCDGRLLLATSIKNRLSRDFSHFKKFLIYFPKTSNSTFTVSFFFKYIKLVNFMV